MKKSVLILASALLLSGPLLGFSKSHLEDHLKKALNLDSSISVQVGEPTPSEFPGLDAVPVTIAGNPYTVLVSTDDKKYIWGQVMDLTVDPDKARMGLVDMKNVHAQGSPKAPVTIVEYSDLQCSYCRKAHEALNEQLYKTYTKDQVRWIYKPYPLSMHPWAESGAVATECAGEQSNDAFWGMTNLFFKNQESITPENFEAKRDQYAKELNLNMAKFKKCLSGDKALARVKADKNEGAKIGVSSTPSFLVNGRLKRGFRDFQELKTLIDDMLKQAGR